MSEAVQARTVARVDEGIWDVPGVGLVRGEHLTLEQAKLALALYGAKERVITPAGAHDPARPGFPRHGRPGRPGAHPGEADDDDDA